MLPVRTCCRYHVCWYSGRLHIATGYTESAGYVPCFMYMEPISRAVTSVALTQRLEVAHGDFYYKGFEQTENVT